MTDAEQDAALEFAHAQILAVEEVSVLMDRLLAGARLALQMAATRRDVHADAITVLQTKQMEHSEAIAELKQSEQTLLDDLKERKTP